MLKQVTEVILEQVRIDFEQYCGCHGFSIERWRDGYNDLNVNFAWMAVKAVCKNKA